MGFIVGLLTFLLVLDCIVLVFLVLIQLPKKDAGAGLAFGGAASDALFGAGSGNVLTKITKYTATIFFVMTIGLAFVESHARTGGNSFLQNLSKEPSALPMSPGPAPAASPSAPTTSSNVPLLPPGTTSTNLESLLPAGTNPPTLPPSK